ncbi:MAG: 2-C-methyl-D-erythritol 2,4-cyclodiphosphate synthase [Planctomycetes bacterium]|nr:2-C-methyl-D-erythritol 2,4-cyclodiphosphate synthase [Planctomycetota bacterium]
MTEARRIGIGWDVHRLEAGRKLVLGGVSIPHDRGLVGHSDGDVILHALADAVLGAAGLGDIGDYFAPEDPKWRDMESTIILHQALAGARARGWVPENADVVLLAEEPKLRERKKEIAAHLAALLLLPVECVNVKAKTAEGLGPVGRKEALEAHAAVLMRTAPPA